MVAVLLVTKGLEVCLGVLLGVDQEEGLFEGVCIEGSILPEDPLAQELPVFLIDSCAVFFVDDVELV